MDDCGPLYNVQMRRGQGYNSYIQEPRIENAVSIIRRPDSTSSTASNTEVATSSADSVVSGKDSGNTPTFTAQTWSDAFTAFMERLPKSGSEASNEQKPKVLPYLLKPSPSDKCNQTVVFSSKQVKSKAEIDQAMGFNASAAIKATSMGPGAEAGSNLATKDDLEANSLNFLVHVRVTNEAKDRNEDWNFEEVACLKDLIDDKEDEHDRAVQFTRIYGDTFISDFVEGGEIYAWIGIKSHDLKKTKKLGAYASAQLTPMAAPVQVSGKMEFNKEKEELFSQAETSIRIQWRGGGEIKNHDFPWGMDNLVQIANAFPSMVAATPAKIRAVLTPYSALKSFQDHRNDHPKMPLPLSYDHCAIYTSTLYEDFVAFRDLCDNLEDMMQNPDDYRRREPEQAADPKREQKGPQKEPSTKPQTINDSDKREPRALLDLKAILEEPSPKLPALDMDPHKLSMMRLLCRSAMTYIQERAANLVIDPDTSVTTVVNDMPHYRLPQYPCPGIIKNLLPTRKWDSKWDKVWENYKPIADLHMPDLVTEDPFNYWWDAVGDNLSVYKDYEHFVIGNFDLDSDAFPQKIATQPHSSRWWKYINKPMKKSQNAIAGIGLVYSDWPSWVAPNPKNKIPAGLKSSTDSEGSLSCRLYAGREPEARSWKDVEERINIPPINRISVYHQLGTGRISGLDFLSHGQSDDEEEAADVSVLLHREWDFPASGDDPKEPEGVRPNPLFPGDNSDDNNEKNWMFAGLVGAFEKVGPFKNDRILAKIAIIWKRRDKIRVV